MARPAGVRNQDFEEKRLALIEKLAEYVLREGVEMPSFRQLAIAADVSEPTLRHYFTDRSGVVVAIIEHFHELSKFMRDATRQSVASVSDALIHYHNLLKEYRSETVFVPAQAFMIRESMSDPMARKAYLKHIIEPSLDALIDLLTGSEGGLPDRETARTAAMMLMSSSIFMILHQELLGGKQHAAIEEPRYFELVRTWLAIGLETNPDGLDRQ